MFDDTFTYTTQHFPAEKENEHTDPEKQIYNTYIHDRYIFILCVWDLYVSGVAVEDGGVASLSVFAFTECVLYKCRNHSLG